MCVCACVYMWVGEGVRCVGVGGCAVGGCEVCVSVCVCMCGVRAYVRACVE